MDCRILAPIIGPAFALASFANAETGYYCSNPDFEISCSTQRCDVTLDEGFTPMGVTVSSLRFEVCAYSGCWIGSPNLVSNDQISFFVQGDLQWRDMPERPVSRMQMAIDPEIGVGIFLGAGFSHPMQCRPWDCGADCQEK